MFFMLKAHCQDPCSRFILLAHPKVQVEGSGSRFKLKALAQECNSRLTLKYQAKS